MVKYFSTLVLVIPLLSAQAEMLTGRVVPVADGDMVTVLDATNTQHKIRVAGIDAPEKKQAIGNRSKDNLAELVAGKNVSVEWTKRDRYQRIVGKIMGAKPSCTAADCPKTVDAGLAQIRTGLAWWYEKYAKEQLPDDAAAYAAAEALARGQTAGLWRYKDPMPPWEFRDSAKAKL